MRLELCPRSGVRNIRFMQGPYWVQHGAGWRELPVHDHTNGEDWVETRLTVDAGAQVVLSTKPFWTAAETDEALAAYEQRLPFVARRRLAVTAEGRDIWAIETESREQSVVITSSFQSAEFAGDIALVLLDWLAAETRRAAFLRDRFQVCIVPETMPDGVARGYSILNAAGQAPMFEGLSAFDGAAEAAAVETRAVVNLLQEKRPTLWIELHVHPGAYNTPKLNPVKASYYPADAAVRAAQVEQAVLALCPDWRYIPLPPDDSDPVARHDTKVLAAERLGTATFCLQDYAPTYEGRKSLFVWFMDAALGALAGKEPPLARPTLRRG